MLNSDVVKQPPNTVYILIYTYTYVKADQRHAGFMECVVWESRDDCLQVLPKLS